MTGPDAQGGWTPSESFDRAMQSVHASPDLAEGAIRRHRARRRRSLVGASAATAVVLAAAATAALASSSGHSHRSLLTGPSPSASASSPPSPPNVCGALLAGEKAIGINADAPYVRPAPAGAKATVSRAAAEQAVRAGGGSELLKASGPMRLMRVRQPQGNACQSSLAWVVYGPTPAGPPPPGAGPTDVCVSIDIIDAHNLQRGSLGVQCAHKPNPTCTQQAPAGGDPLQDVSRWNTLATSAGRWQRLPASPLAPREMAVVVWAGRQLLVWGGESGAGDSTLHNDGAAYDPQTKTWTALPAAPIGPRVQATAIWTGTELLIWGGYDEADHQRLHVTNSGAAYNPQTRHWRLLPKSPLTAAAGAAGVWTGREAIIVNGRPAVMTNTDRGIVQAAAYNPSTNRWRKLPAQPAGTPSYFNETALASTGTLVLAFHQYGIDNDPAGVTLDAYDPTANRWTHLTKCGGAGWVANTYPDGADLLIPPEYQAPGWLYNVDANSWTPIAPAPLEATTTARTPDGLLAVTATQNDPIQPGATALWNAQTNSWTKGPRIPDGIGIYAVAVDTGTTALIWTDNSHGDLYTFIP